MPENNPSYNPNRYECCSKYPDAPSPSRHYEIAIGLLLLAAATAAVFVAFYSAEYADYRCPALWWLPLVGGMALAAWLADHALGYLVG